MSKKIKVLFYNKFWDKDFPDYNVIGIPDFHFFYEQECIQDADVVVFHIPSLEVDPQRLKALKKEGQVWVYWSFECELHYPEFEQNEIRSLFDIKVTYKTDADIHVSYLAQYRLFPWKMEPAAKTGFINAFFSSSWDKSGRYDYLGEIMSYVNVDSYGKIMNNRGREGGDPYPGYATEEAGHYKTAAISRYKFTLAFENAISKDYVTEKFYQPLLAGSVPVYLGAPNVDEFAPGDNCYINVNSFSSAKELAGYLKFLDSHDDLYSEFLAWKEKPLRVEFENKLHSYDMFERFIAIVRKKFTK
ncbi:glycosyltransferase family 10 [Flavitalea sp. BT771]|uniref:glycosyltransferase family 10 domain-containing protein n=1 Tax=Flavitalea sp. BT771 TaxID=3063329 RepID=UPI0026E16295|nr:glycosyltransferase family 10 [Flavitalea sp. BT771]MDO6435740.1 glycosyltransferase family 10 [Flavitalea sp. BT771]MDV6224641.1 glycosyltransferase family 10 [Flavitalea sp. BT771]